MMVWHYTIKQRLDRILVDGLIKPATVFVPPNEKPVVWFSSNQIWEETANKILQDSTGIRRGNKKETHEHGGGLARIGVAPEAAPYTWNDFKRLSGIQPKAAKLLYQAAIAGRARPGEWFVSFEAVSSKKWLAIELFDGTNWIPFDEKHKGR